MQEEKAGIVEAKTKRAGMAQGSEYACVMHVLCYVL